MKYWKPIVGALLVFVFGMVTGGIMTGVAMKKRVRVFVEGGPAKASSAIVHRLDTRLHLSGSQRDRLQEIISRTQSELGEVRKTTAPEVAEILERADREIKNILNDKQREKFQGLSERYRRRWNTQ